MGICPQYNINEDFNLQLELGLDHVQTEDESRTLGKTTFAAAYTFGESGSDIVGASVAPITFAVLFMKSSLAEATKINKCYQPSRMLLFL
ncbi:hypothetical protein KGB56_06860 [Pseudovibrio brasiliensis]|uniref:Uncharacterized protein n=1 Tax=Pseudovibrio brasiliensis TaxID=1898042 RepID=A0ABX8AUQ4_9HYPH|nr:hypothetical protein KGB56_06860 [Pseudovibrio brasiliensis]